MDESTVSDVEAEPERCAGGEAARGARENSSPYATGGGGVTLERRVGALYLARLLTGDTTPELGDDREVRSVAFQQAPRVPVDDLVVEAARPDESEPSLELSIAIRRNPNLVRSDEESRKLIGEYLRALAALPGDGRERRLALAVGGHPRHSEEVAELTNLARRQRDAESFFAEFDSGRHRRQLVDRLGQIEGLVERALAGVTEEEFNETVVRGRTWELLRSLWVLMERVEEPDTSDWAGAQNRLVTVARGRDLGGAGRLLDRLEVLAGQYAPSAATVDRSLLRREVHPLLDEARRRNAQAWELVELLHQQAQAAVRSEVGEGENALHIDRGSESAAVMSAIEGASALIVGGESGAGKSAAVVGAAISAAEESNGEMEVLCLNLRHLPEASFRLVADLGCSMEGLLAELSAPERILVVDGADAAIEARRDLFLYLVEAARSSGVRLVAITSSDAQPVVRDLAAGRMNGEAVAEHVVPGLSDEQLDEVAAAFPSLARLVANPRSRELLRRLVIVDLLVRSGMSGLPLSDVDAMREIWRGLVRNHERRDRGLPDAREQVLLCLASWELAQGDAGEVAGALDPAALDGLRQDGVLRTSEGNPWHALPEFAHDEIRRYAVARVLLADGVPAEALLKLGAPRWALAAGRLACQAVLDAPDSPSAPVRGRLERQQAEFDRLVEAGHGLRWADVPAEALLSLGDPAPVLADAWPALRKGNGAGLQRVLRLIHQRHDDPARGGVDPVVVEPVIALLLEEAAPWTASEEVARTLRGWLLALVVRNTPGGHPLRIRLRELMVARCDEADQEMRDREAATAAAAARSEATPDENQRERERLARESELMSAVIGRSGRRRRDRPRLPRELTDDTILELLALLGPDLGDDGERLLRRVAGAAPWDLSPAVEEIGAGKALAQYGRGLLAVLVEAYYLDENADGSGFHEEGIRHHRWRGPVAPLAAWYRGPFYALLESDFRRGVAVLNRLLNHAARARIQTLASIGSPWNRLSDKQIVRSGTEMRITGEIRTYIGDGHVWLWYRGTGVGPYPCMSALQALERFCDQLLLAGIPAERLVAILLEGCENLAMPGLVVGLLTRHLERAGTLLDPYLEEPHVWHWEFQRVVHESGGLAASSEGLVEPERRRWSLREAATWLTLQADRVRADELRAVGDRLVARAAEMEPEAAGDEPVGTREDARPVSFTSTVRNWASALDRSRYRTRTEGDRLYIQSTPPEDVEAALRPGNEDLQRGQEAISLLWRHSLAGLDRREKPEPQGEEELASDVIAARELLEDRPAASPVDVWDVAAAAPPARWRRSWCEG